LSGYACVGTIQLFRAGFSTLRCLFVEWFFFNPGFVNKHHWNVIANGVHAPAGDTLQTATIGFQLHLSFTSGTGKYL
jgi:hypothetical protein